MFIQVFVSPSVSFLLLLLDSLLPACNLRHILMWQLLLINMTKFSGYQRRISDFNARKMKSIIGELLLMPFHSFPSAAESTVSVLRMPISLQVPNPAMLPANLLAARLGGRSGPSRSLVVVPVEQHTCTRAHLYRCATSPSTLTIL